MIFHRFYCKGGQSSGSRASTGNREHAGGGSAKPREMTNDEMLAKLREAAANNPELAAQLKQEFGGSAAKPKAEKKAATAAPNIDVVDIYHNQGGEGALRKALSGLSDAELKAIIKKESMDSAHRTGKWKGDKLRDHIVAAAKKRSEFGKPFATYTDASGNLVNNWGKK